MDKFSWSSDTYLRFQQERTQPSKDLAAAIKLSSPKRIIDIGCGPGKNMYYWIMNVMWLSTEKVRETAPQC